jgi:hypothetical protein
MILAGQRWQASVDNRKGAMMRRTCRDDGDPVVWATTLKRARAILNPAEQRTVLGELVQVDSDPPGAPFAFVLDAPGRSALLAKVVDAHLDHHATCARTASVPGLRRQLVRLARLLVRAAVYQGTPGYQAADRLLIIDLASGEVTVQ